MVSIYEAFRLTDNSCHKWPNTYVNQDRRYSQDTATFLLIVHIFKGRALLRYLDNNNPFCRTVPAKSGMLNISKLY